MTEHDRTSDFPTPRGELPPWAIRVRQLTDEINQTHVKAAEKKMLLQQAYDSGLSLAEIARMIGVSRERVSILLGRPVRRARAKKRRTPVTVVANHVEQPVEDASDEEPACSRCHHPAHTQHDVGGCLVCPCSLPHGGL